MSRLDRGRGGKTYIVYFSWVNLNKNTSQGVGSDEVDDKEWNGLYVEDQVGDGVFDIGGRREKAGIFLLFGKSTKQENIKDKGIDSKKQNV